MKNFKSVRLLVSLLFLSSLSASAAATAPVDYVNPYIGSISHMLVPCFPTIQLPNSLMRIYPTRGEYTHEMLDGLPMVVTNHRESSAFCLSVTQGSKLEPVISTNWDQERITPYDYQVQIADNSIDAHLAVSHQSAIYEITFQDPSKPATVLLYSEGGFMKANQKKVAASQRLSRRMNIYFSGEFDVQPQQVGILREGNISQEHMPQSAFPFLRIQP